ncbi:MAG: amino acid adenylation domain-containing protein [Bosea sp. (in: a-proteobacteria)]
MTLQQKPPVDTRTLLPLSHAQRGVWLDARLIDDPGAYQLGCLIAFDGEIDPDLARQAVRLMLARHEGLRLRVSRDAPEQWLEPAGAPPFAVIDLSAAEDAEAALRRHVRAAQAKGFALGDEPLFRIDLIRLGPGSWRLLMLAHHLAVDGVSIGLAQLYWLQAYRSLSGDSEDIEEASQESAIPRSSYRPVIAEDEAYAASLRYQQDMAYWQTRLSPLPGLLFAGRPAASETGAPTQQGDGDAPVIALDRSELAAFEAAAKAAGTTLHRALLATIAIALSRRYRHDDFTLGMALHRRDLSTRHVIGMLAGMAPVRCRIAPADDLQRAVQTLAEGFDADLRHQRLPIDALGRALAAAGAFGDRAERSLFDVAVTMMPAMRDTRPHIAGRPVGSTPLRLTEISSLGLYVDEWPDQAGLSIACRFNPARLTRAEVRRFAGCLREIVAAFAAGDRRELSAFDGMDPVERTLLSAWSRGMPMTIPELTLPALFARQRAAQPDAPAVLADDGGLSYAELDAAADAVAHRLRASGAVLGEAVGVCLPRALHSVVALLGVLKAGCVYLPLDPAYPPERLAAMIADAGAARVVATAETASALPAGVVPLRLDDADPRAAETALACETHAPTPDSRAYIVYTSGSTGRPKGVAMSHRALVNLAFARRKHDPIGPGDRVLAAISIGFDVSLGQLLTPLLAGACVVVAGDLRGVSGPNFWEFIRGHRVTHVNSVPSFFEAMLPDAPAETPLEQLMLGGESLSGALAARLRQRLRVPLYNMYGPTEACIDATAFAVPPDGGEASAALPIGRPLPNYSVHVLDAALDPVGIGADGELCIGGAGLAEGYLNLPEATAERFVAHPRFGRLYRTGDRGCWREDGQLAFLGRSDAQVKIRGFRVEPGEVEALLRTHPGVAQAAVIARRDAQGAMRLLGYAVPAAGCPGLAAKELHGFLQGRLPAHMTPAAIMLLDALPLTHHGKLDERALPVPQGGEEAGEAPRSATEKLLAASFATLLGVVSVDTGSHFFELGGHSLLATQLASRLRQALGIELPIRLLFEAPRLGDLASRIDGLLAEGPDDATSPTDDWAMGPRPARIPLSFEQERLWFLHKLDPASPAYNIAVAFRLDGALDIAALQAALAALVARHESLRTRFAESDGEPAQIVLAEAEFGFCFEDVSAAGGDAGARRARAEALRPFDLAGEPLLRVLVLRLATDTHILLVTMHHIVSDGWSVGILQSELAALYLAATAGREPALAPLPAQYADYALWQRQRLGPREIAGRVAFWTEQLAGAPDMLTLPLDHRRPERRSDAGASCAIAFTPELAKALIAFSRARQATPFIVLAAAWAALMSRWSGQDDVVLGAPVANRGQAQTQGLIGFFVNTIALRVDIAGRPGFGALVDRLRARALDAYANADLPFEQVVDALKPVRTPGVHPLFQSVIAYQAAPPAAVAFGGLAASVLPLPESAAKFDLTLVVNETEQGFDAAITYALDLFQPQTMANLASQFRRLLEAALAEPDRPVAQLPLADEAVMARLVAQSRPRRSKGAIDTIPALFARQVALQPGAEAVRFEAVSLSFAELDRRANRLAHALINWGVGPGRPVAVVLGRSDALVVAALGIMKAGGVYMPVDPAHPVERIAAILSGATPAVALVDGATHHLVSRQWPALLNEAGDWNGFKQHDPGDADRLGPLTAQATAYIIHTSGSTGQPKGVAVSHGALATLAAARLEHDPVGPGDRVLATLSVSFDVSIGQLVTPLLSGATVVVAGDVAAMSGEAFWSLMAREAITHLNSGPAFLDAMLETPPPPLALRRLMLGGEAFPVALARKLRAALPRTEIVNVYGPTETCIDATVHRYDGTETGATLPIGKPMPDYRAIVLDEAMQPVPAGVVGEIFIGGPGLASHYHGLAQETAARFLQDPFGAPGERLYRSGDLARLNAAGEIEFLGRADQQVKIRGFRIELEEVAAALRSHPAIRSAVAVTRKRGDETCIVAYAVPADEGAAAISDWRAHVEARLPHYMTPSALVLAPALPMTVNGKLDIAALPEPAGMDAMDSSRTPPRDARDAALVAIWAALLQVAPIGIDDNFFRLGGHSLQALRLAAACKAQLQIELPIAAIYRHQTIRALSDAIASGKALQPRGPLVQLGRGEGRPVFCFHPVGGASFGYIGLAEALAGRRPVYGVQASGLEAGEPLAETVDAMMEDYLAAIRAVQPVGPYALMGHSFGGLAAFEITRRLEAVGETVDRLVLLDTSAAGEPWTMEMAQYTAHRIVRLERERSGSTAPIDPEQERRVAAIVANNMRLSEAYAPAKIATPMIYLLARRGDLPADGRRAFWEAMSERPLPYPPLDCDHYAVLNRDNVSKLASLFEPD